MSRQVLAEPDPGLSTKSWASLEDGTPLVTGEHRGKGLLALFHVSADMRWSDLPMSGTFVEMLRKDRRQLRLHLHARRRRRRRNRQGDAGAAACARRFRRVRPAARDRKTAAGRLQRSRHAGSSAGLLWPRRRTGRGQHACRRRPHRAARHLGPARTARDLHQCRAARPPRHAAVGRARAVPDRCAHRRHARRRTCRADPPPRCAGRDPACDVRGRRVDRAMAVARRKQRRIRDARSRADPARLCRHRQCRRRFNRQSRHGRADAVPRATHRAGSRRSRRRRSRA